MANSEGWTRVKTKTLIEMLEASPELWDTMSKSYKDRTKRNAALQRIAEHFSVSVTEISRKLHNLRTQMNNELRKIKKRKSGDGADDVVFSSNWEFFEALKFLIQGMTCNTTETSLKLHCNTESDVVDENLGSPQNQESGDTTNKRQSINTPGSSHSIKQQNKKKVSKDDELLALAIGELKKKDDDDIFGEYVASSLRGLNQANSKRILKKKIQLAIIEMTDRDAELSYSNSLSNQDEITSPCEENIASNWTSRTSPSTSSSHTLLDISSRTNSAASYYETFGDEPFIS